MARIILHGSLAKFGGPYKMNVSSAAEGVYALASQMPEFGAAIRAGTFKLVRGNRKTGFQIGEDDLRIGIGESDLHVTPVVRGSKGSGGGGGKMILGAVIMIAAIVASPFTGGASLAVAMSTEMSIAGFAVSYGSIAMMGVSMMLSGVSQMLSPQLKPSNPNSFGGGAQDRRSSFLLNGPTNTVDQGNPVPLIYGRCMVGSTPVSAGLDTENIDVATAVIVGGTCADPTSVTASLTSGAYYVYPNPTPEDGETYEIQFSSNAGSTWTITVMSMMNGQTEGVYSPPTGSPTYNAVRIRANASQRNPSNWVSGTVT